MRILFANKYYKVVNTKELPGGLISYLIKDEDGHTDWINNPDEVIDYIDLRECYNKESAIELCNKYNTTVNQACLENIENIIAALYKIHSKILNNEKLENHDWVNAAVPLRSIMNILLNHWYLKDK